MYAVIVALVLLLLAICGMDTCGFRQDSKYGGRLRRKDIVKVDEQRSRSEEVAVAHIERIMGKPFPTVRPAWLIYNGHQLELDGYNEETQTAIEFQGPLHDKFYPTKESYSSYYDRLLRDQFKIAACKKRGVLLVVLSYHLPSHHWANYIKSRLVDAGKIDKLDPAHYIDVQPIVPYRNEHVEAELGLFGLQDAKK